MYTNNPKHEEKAAANQRRIFGRRYEGACLSKIHQFGEKESGQLASFLETPKNFLVFLGNPGIGKTYFCSALIPWATQRFNSLRYWHEDVLLETLRDRISQGNGDYLRYLSLMIDDDLVIVDDLGCSRPNEWREEVLFRIINMRYNSMKPTVITSNLTRSDIHKRFHPRVADRLFASENIVIESHEDESLRKSGL